MSGAVAMVEKGPKARIDAMFATSMQKPAGASAAVFRLSAEAGRVDSILLRAVPPLEVGAAPVAPAQGAMRIEREYEGQSGGTRRIVGHHLERADVFDAMILNARRAHVKAEAKRLAEEGLSDEDARPFVSPFTPGQVYMARHYRDLTEKHEAGGIKCSSIEAMAGGQGGSFMDAYLRDGDELKRIHWLIGHGSALVLRRQRPSSRGSKVTILDRKLVDAVCLHGQSLSEVLVAHGWAKDTDNLNVLRRALSAALDRMTGYRDRIVGLSPLFFTK